MAGDRGNTVLNVEWPESAPCCRSRQERRSAGVAPFRTSVTHAQIGSVSRKRTFAFAVVRLGDDPKPTFPRLVRVGR